MHGRIRGLRSGRKAQGLGIFRVLQHEKQVLIGTTVQNGNLMCSEH